MDLRRSLRMTGAAIAAKLGLARSTVAPRLRREGLGRLAQVDPPEPMRRYRRERPGEPIHPDIETLGRFDQPGHRVTGTRAGRRNRGAGRDVVHGAVDGGEGGRPIGSRERPNGLASVEALADERQHTATAFWLRALRRFRSHGIQVERAMTDTGSAHRSHRFAKTLRLLGIRHIVARAYTPKTNGKAERLIRTPIGERAYGLARPSSQARNADLPPMARLVQPIETARRTQRPATRQSGE